MRIALIAPLVTPIVDGHLGGAQAVVADLARELTMRGHDVVLYAAPGSALEGVAVSLVEMDGAAVAQDTVRPGVERPASAAMEAAYEAVYDAVAGGRYDAVHNHGFDGPAFRVAAARGVGVLHTLHLPPSRLIASALDDARRTAPVVCAAVSQAHASAWSALTTVDCILRNGVPLDDIAFAPRALGSALVAARFSPEKGVREGIAAARAAGLDVDVYGMPYDAGYERFVRHAWRLDRRVRFHRPVPRPVLWQAFGGAAVTVCLSQWDEPFGMVAAESQAAGTPVVATARGGLPEVVRDGVTGHLVDGADTAAATEAVRRALVLDRGDCRRHAEESLGLGAAVTAHEDLYARLAGSSRPRG